MDKRSMGKSAVTDFLDEVTEQIAYKPLRPTIRQELETHIEDRIDECRDRGMTQPDAIDRALHNMGDAVSIGTELNAIHYIQKAPVLTAITALLFLAGFLLSLYLHWTGKESGQYVPDHMIYNVFFYIAGGVLFLLTVIKGYPFLIRKRKAITGVTVIIYLLLAAAYFRSRFVSSWYDVYLIDSTVNIATLFFIPLLTILMYCSRRNAKKAFLITLGSLAAWIVLICTVPVKPDSNTVVITLLSTVGTICFMIYRRILPGRKKHLYPITIILAVLLGCPLMMTANSRVQTKNFLLPKAKAAGWSDYNYESILIRELLSKTPLTHSLSLTADEMMSYGTGVWYFPAPDPQQLFINAAGIETEEQKQAFQTQVQDLDSRGYAPKLIGYTAEQVTLWDILPGHYTHYLPVICMFLFGRLPGLLINGIMILFYVLIFAYIHRIHGQLASSLAFSCGQCLLWQGGLYVLRMFGYGFWNDTVPSLPLISEGCLSIVFNLLLLGLIFSSYRYDRLTEEVLELPSSYPEQTTTG